MDSSNIPPAPPPLPPPAAPANRPTEPALPHVEREGPAGAFLLELIVANGYPFKDHWSYFLRSHQHPDVGVVLHATGEVANGFRFEVKRSFDFREPGNRPSKRIPLQWIEARHCDEARMLNGGMLMFDDMPVCGFEESVHKVPAPGKTLNTVADGEVKGKKITQRNCQTWIIESADQLVRDGILLPQVAAYLRATEQ